MPRRSRATASGETGRTAAPIAASGDAGTSAPQSLSEIERQHIIEVLEQVGGNKVAAAKVLGLTRWTLYRRMELYGLGDKTSDPVQ